MKAGPFVNPAPATTPPFLLLYPYYLMSGPISTIMSSPFIWVAKESQAFACCRSIPRPCYIPSSLAATQVTTIPSSPPMTPPLCLSKLETFNLTPAHRPPASLQLHLLPYSPKHVTNITSAQQTMAPKRLSGRLACLPLHADLNSKIPSFPLLKCGLATPSPPPFFLSFFLSFFYTLMNSKWRGRIANDH